jgi:tetratricopeptide (TPR) repeat protein
MLRAADDARRNRRPMFLQRETTLARWCERIIEGGWLLALVFIPNYFNLLSARHFEPDKATTLRSIVLVMAAAALIRWIDGLGAPRAAPAAGDTPRPGIWKRFSAVPMAVPIAVYALVFLLATAVSVVPGVSFFCSYQRLQGAYTNLSYIALAVLIMLTVRRRAQFERLITVTILGSLGAVGYGLVQHFQFDPLPWKGDVVSRVASTMGNSIFVAAYLIMIVPYALYRVIASLHEARTADAPARPAAEVGWAAGYALAIAGSLLLLFAAVEFGAVVRVATLGWWWVFPGALVVATGLYILPTLGLHHRERVGLAGLVPGLLAVGYALVVGLAFLVASPTTRAQPGRIGLEWPVWMVIAAYALLFVLPRLGEAPSRLWLRMHGVGMLLIAGLLLVTIFFTQSRGPWIGLGASLFVFVTLLLLRAWQRARAGGTPRAALWRNLLVAEVVLAVALGGLLVLFNISDAPAVQQLRRVPYIGRMGTLLETDSGTGLVRRLIWFGDDKAGGAVGLITSDPLRLIVGWGPESMFVAYNRFYPPALANIESRGASPDRSHEAYLDELVNKGLLGLISYLFVLISFFVLAWRLARRVPEWRWEVCFLAAIAVVTAHCVEGFTGIPIVATLMLLWVTIAVVVVGGALAGAYTLGSAAPAPAPAPAAAAPARAANQGRAAARKRGAVARGAPPRGAAAGRPARDGSGLSWLIAGMVLAVALALVWFVNIENVYADMRFQQGQVYGDNPRADLTDQLLALNYYLDAINKEPGQDFYYLNLGRTLMSIVDIRRQNPKIPLGEPKPDARLEDLLANDLWAAQEFVLRTQVDEALPGAFPGSDLAPARVLNQPLQETMSYAETALKRARELNPLNKDHYANLARLHSFWFSRLTRDPEHLRQAINWYEQGTTIAPQDVTILNEYAGAVALMGSYLESQRDAAAAQTYYDQADALLKRSAALDPRYSDTPLRQADLLRLRGRTDDAVSGYVALIGQNPHALDPQIGGIIEALRGQPEQLRRLRDAYDAALAKKPDDPALQSYVGMLSARAGDLPAAAQAFSRQIALQPSNLEARRNYMLVLSDTGQYAQAADQAQQLRALVQQSQPDQSVAELDRLIELFRARAGGG